MSRELANRIALEAKYLGKLELEKQAECSAGRLYLMSQWQEEDDAVDYITWWGVSKDKDGVMTLSYEHDNFEISQYSPVLANYIADNYRAMRKADAVRHPQEYSNVVDELPVEVCLRFSKAERVPLLVVSDVEELAAKIDTVLQVYKSGRTRMS